MSTNEFDNKSQIMWGTCIDPECGYEGEESQFDYDYEYDSFWGIEYKYLICPKCGGGVELSKVNDIDNN